MRCVIFPRKIPLNKRCIIVISTTLWLAFLLFLNSSKYLSTNVRPARPKIHHDSDWTSITKNLLVYSAFWDARNVKHSPLVRLVAIGLLQGSEKTVKCALKSNQSVTYVPARRRIIAEHWNTKHSAMFYLCVPETKTRPDYVALESDGLLSRWKSVTDTTRTSSERNVAVCVRPLFGPYNDTLRIAEFVAYHDLMGVTRFTFYDRNITEFTRTYLSLLKKNGMRVDLLPWSLPSNIDVWEEGQLAFIQDCIYRHAKEFEFVAILDLDELIVPKGNQTLRTIVESSNENMGAFVFKNVFFCQDVDDPGESLMSETGLTREDFIWEYFQRSKMMVRPRGVITSGIHDVQNFVEGYDYVKVDQSSALLHHYRILSYYNITIVCNSQSKLVKDEYTLRFVKTIKGSLAMTYWKI